MVDPIKTNSQVETCTIWEEQRDTFPKGTTGASSSYTKKVCNCPSDEPLDTGYNFSFFSNYQGHGFKDTGEVCDQKAAEQIPVDQEPVVKETCCRTWEQTVTTFINPYKSAIEIKNKWLCPGDAIPTTPTTAGSDVNYGPWILAGTPCPEKK